MRRAPGYFNGVHGIAVDPATNDVFVNDRYNHRIQVFHRRRRVPSRLDRG